MSTPELVLGIHNLSKTFPGQRALRDVSMDVRQGEIHALVGENGSGKSTLIKCLAGFHQPDDGARITIGAQEMPVPYTPADAISAGCGFIHQDLGLVDDLTVMENLALSSGFETGPFGKIRWRAQAKRSRELLAAFGDHIKPRQVVGRLSHADKTLVAIARGLQDASDGGKVLVLDEPTAALPASEVGALFKALRRVTATGIGIVYVSHRLNEIFEIADRVTTLRDGAKVTTVDIADLNERKLVELIVGKPLDAYYPQVSETVRDDVVLSVRKLNGPRLRDVTFELHSGEILGIAGLLGSGRSELARLVFGAQPPESGQMKLQGKAHAPREPRNAIDAGVALIPEDRRAAGSHPSLTLRENITLSELSKFKRGGRLSRRLERRETEDLIRRFNIRPPVAEKKFATFSGGNQQKAVLAKWMRLNPKLLVLDEPVQGVDIGSRTEIYNLIEGVAKGGTAVLMIDSELEDLCVLCDRILVLHAGRIVRELSGADRTRDRILEVLYTGAAA